MGDVVTSEVTHVKWDLVDAAVMNDCHRELREVHGYLKYIEVRSAVAVGGTVGWEIQVNTDDPQFPAKATLGNVVVFFNGTVEALTPEQYTQKWTTGGA